MSLTISEKILKQHLVSGNLITGEEIGIKFDQTLTHDVTGTLGYLAFEALGLKRVKTELSVSYVDHNLLQTDYKNMDDHLFLQTTAAKFGVVLSRAGNGICHSNHYQRFAIPGKTLIGSDSHTTTTGGVGTLCIGAGALDVAMAMAGEPYYMKMPEIINVELTGKLKPGVAAKDIILELLKNLTVKGGLNKIFEYTGNGVTTLSVPERCTITNMGAELGATSSIFPSDEVTKKFFKAQDRLNDYTELLPDKDAKYSETIKIDLNALTPLIAKPEMPDNVEEVKNLSDVKVNQVFIGSCTNASYEDIAKAARILKGKTVHENVSLSISAGTRQTFRELLRDGIIEDLVASGARILECSCGACTGIGQAPNTDGVSIRTSNRNFKGRSGSLNANLYLTSPETAAACAIKGYICSTSDVIDADTLQDIKEPSKYKVDDTLFIHPPLNGENIEVYRGPNIKPLPVADKLQNNLSLKVSAKVNDNITTDDIIPASSTFSALRSNVPEISKITFSRIDKTFVERAKLLKESIIIAGENYGQGSSREHAAVAPMYLGVKIVIAKSIARIHKANLINFGILPLLFKSKEDYQLVEQEDELVIENIYEQISNNEIIIKNISKNCSFVTTLECTQLEKAIIIAGGKFNYIKNKLSKENV